MIRQRLGLSLFDWNEVTFGAAGVDLAWPIDSGCRVAVHFAPVSNPAGKTPNGEQHRKHLDWNAQSTVDDARVEIDVGVQLSLDEVLVLQRNFFKFLCHLE